MNIFYSSLDILSLIHSKISQIEYLENFGKGINGYHTYSTAMMQTLDNSQCMAGIIERGEAYIGSPTFISAFFLVAF